MVATIHEPMIDRSTTPRIYRILVGAVGGQGGGAISEIIYNAIRIERLKHGGEKARVGSYEKRSMTPGLAQRSGSTITSVSFLDPKLTEDQLPDSFVISEMPHRASCDVVIAQEINELMKYLDRCKPDGWVLANEVRTITPVEKLPNYVAKTSIEDQVAVAKQYLNEGTYIGIDGNKIIRDNNMDPRTLNVIMMGILSKAGILPIDRESFLEALALRFQGKVLDMNIVAFELGEQYFAEGKYKERDPKFSWEDLTIDEIIERGLNHALQFKRRKEKTRKNLHHIFQNLRNEFPETLAKYVIEGYAQLFNFEGKHQAEWYLAMTRELFQLDRSENKRLTLEFARNMAGRIMQWDGPFRVAQYAVHDEFAPQEGNQLFVMEKKLAPTVEEITGMLPLPYFFYRRVPRRLVTWYQRNKFRGRSMDIKTTSFWGYSFFWLLSKFIWMRRFTIRYKREKRLIQAIYADLNRLHQVDPELAAELAAYIGKIRGYSFIRHAHIEAYFTLVKGIDEVLEAQDSNVARYLIQNAYLLIDNSASTVEQLEMLIEEHKKGEYRIPLNLPE